MPRSRTPWRSQVFAPELQTALWHALFTEQACLKVTPSAMSTGVLFWACFDVFVSILVVDPRKGLHWKIQAAYIQIHIYIYICIHAFTHVYVYVYYIYIPISTLHRLKVLEKIIGLIGSFYANPQFKVKLGDEESDGRIQSAGIRPGCPLSPYFFVLLMVALLVISKLNYVPNVNNNQLMEFTSQRFCMQTIR